MRASPLAGSPIHQFRRSISSGERPVILIIIAISKPSFFIFLAISTFSSALPLLNPSLMAVSIAALCGSRGEAAKRLRLCTGVPANYPVAPASPALPAFNSIAGSVKTAITEN